MKKAIVFLSDGFEEIEAFTVVDYLRRAQIEVVTVSVPPAGKSSIDMPVGSHNICVKADCDFEDFFKNQKELPDLVYTPGGMPGAVNLASCKEVVDFIKACFENGKYIAAICAAPAVVLAKTGILRGKNWTCYPGMEANLSEYCGSKEDMLVNMSDAVFIGGKPFVTDGTIITGRGPGAAEEFAMELVRLLSGSEIAEKVKKASMQR